VNVPGSPNVLEFKAETFKRLLQSGVIILMTGIPSNEPPWA
jgi:hypothetical protein